MQSRDVQRLVNYISCLQDFEIHDRSSTVYNHMGATICDSVLQAGMNYRNVVFPRVQQLQKEWPTAVTTTQFLRMASLRGLDKVLKWNDEEKPARIIHLAFFLVEQKVETELDFQRWFIKGDCRKLREVRGVGPKTVDYMKSLVGVPAVAVDRHVRTFVRWAGIQETEYAHINEVVSRVALKLNINQSSLDHAIWNYVSLMSVSDRKSQVA